MTLIKAAIELVELSTEFMQTQECDGDNFQVAMYTYEHADIEIPKFKAVIRALRQFMRPIQSQWHWCLFTPQGLYQCYSDGRNCNADGEPVEDDVMPVWTDDELKREGVDPSFPK